ncbi:hypothetical protein PI126_g5321 [Phytophthora idaei]|nr:hypothetical protein PI126_g5321 [Phytophthora idaei]
MGRLPLKEGGGRKERKNVRSSTTFETRLAAIKYYEENGDMSSTVERFFPALSVEAKRSKKRVVYAWIKDREKIEKACESSASRSISIFATSIAAVSKVSWMHRAQNSLLDSITSLVVGSAIHTSFSSEQREQIAFRQMLHALAPPRTPKDLLQTLHAVHVSPLVSDDLQRDPVGDRIVRGLKVEEASRAALDCVRCALTVHDAHRAVASVDAVAVKLRELLVKGDGV